eukprot:COSAG01_NODE_14823_length_1405_cov_43.957887_2_plen_110_part_01
MGSRECPVTYNIDKVVVATTTKKPALDGGLLKSVHQLHNDGTFEHGTAIPKTIVAAHPTAFTLAFNVGTHKFQQPLVAKFLNAAQKKLANGKAQDAIWLSTMLRKRRKAF